MTSIITLFFLFFLTQLENFECSNSNISNCNKSELTLDGDEICVECEDKHFPLFNNLYCFPCDDKLYGQLGCGGNCNSSNYKENRIAFCNPEECKKGYGYLNGICFNCSNEQPGCKTCKASETIVEGQKAYSYICTECLNNEYLLDNKTNICKKCSMENCIKCHYNAYLDQECEKCKYGYYLTSDKTCKKCDKKYINNGYCYVCSDDPNNYAPEECYCYINYGLNENKSCSYCEDNNCIDCLIYSDNNIKCTSCSSGSTLSEEKKKCLKCSLYCDDCIIIYHDQTACRDCYSGSVLSDYNSCKDCPANCYSCTINDICTSCYSGYVLSSYGRCKECIDGCDKCIINKDNTTSCLSCSNGYYYELNGTCTRCDLDYTGGNRCKRCGYNNGTLKYECYECYEYKLDDNYRIKYSYIFNDKICKPSEEINLSKECL